MLSTKSWYDRISPLQGSMTFTGCASLNVKINSVWLFLSSTVSTTTRQHPHTWRSRDLQCAADGDSWRPLRRLRSSSSSSSSSDIMTIVLRSRLWPTYQLAIALSLFIEWLPFQRHRWTILTSCQETLKTLCISTIDCRNYSSMQFCLRCIRGWQRGEAIYRYPEILSLALLDDM